jgi:hypothetical protein
MKINLMLEAIINRRAFCFITRPSYFEWRLEVQYGLVS